MGAVVCILAVMCATNEWANEFPTQKLSLEKAKVGGLPAGWKSGVTGKAPGSEWKIVEDKTAPSGQLALAQTSKSPSAVFNLCFAEEPKHKDVEISVAFKAVAGKGDQGGGVMWRAKDINNYYIVRMNPLEENFRFYAVAGGKRKELASKDIKADSGKWHTLRVVHKGQKIQCYLNGQLLIDMTDDTFLEAGFVGLWTKADAETYFADFQVVAVKE